MKSIDEYWKRLKEVVSKHPKGKPLDDRGQFYPDPTPVAPPVGFSADGDIDMFERVRAMVRREMSDHAQAAGFESFEEADDFDVDEEVEPFSPYELILEQARPDGPVVNPDPDQPAPIEKPLPAAPEGPREASPKKRAPSGKTPIREGGESDTDA